MTSRRGCTTPCRSGPRRPRTRSASPLEHADGCDDDVRPGQWRPLPSWRRPCRSGSASSLLARTAAPVASSTTRLRPPACRRASSRRATAPSHGTTSPSRCRSSGATAACHGMVRRRLDARGGTPDREPTRHDGGDHPVLARHRLRRDRRFVRARLRPDVRVGARSGSSTSGGGTVAQVSGRGLAGLLVRQRDAWSRSSHLTARPRDDWSTRWTGSTGSTPTSARSRSGRPRR